MKAAQGIPRVLVRIEGEALSDADGATLQSVRVQERLSAPTLCELAFADPPASLAAERARPGAALEVHLPGTDAPLFSGRITALEYTHDGARGRVVYVRGYDALIELRMRQSLRRFAELTTQELVGELVGPVGLHVESAVETPFWRNRIQSDQSDLELLEDVCRRAGLFFTLRGSALHLVTLEGLGEPLPLELGKSLLDARVQLSQVSARHSIDACGWDPLAVQDHAERVDRARTPADPVAATLELEAPCGERYLIDLAVEDAVHARGAAQAELDDRTARARVFSGTAEGDPRLRAGARVVLRDLAPPAEGVYVLTRVDHLLDAHHGFVTHLGSEPPPRPPAPRAHVALGIVSDVDDPEDRGRVRVTLPTFGAVETDWLAVLCPAAGADKGFIALPDVGDSVLVALVHGDAAEGIVLGGLFGQQAPPDAGIHAGAVRRYTLRTPGGQKLQLDDDDRALRIETTKDSSAEWAPDRVQIQSSSGNRLTLEGSRIVLRNRSGSRVELSGNRVIVHAEKELVLRAPGGNVRIQGAAIDFERQ